MKNGREDFQMDAERRYLVTMFALGITTAALPATSHANDQKTSKVPKQPNRKDFQSGDFLWPKKEGAFIPYAAAHGSDRATDAAQWTRARDAYIATIEAAPSKTELDKQRLARLKSMTYREFRALYANDSGEGTPTPRGGGASVGHVAIVDIDSVGTPWIIEALMSRNTIRRTYDDWVRERADDLVWHGRLKNFSPADRSKIADVARTQVGKPYKFWNFNLEDDSGFYCSKLAWMSTYRALETAIDGNDNPRRLLWVSPKKLLKQNAIEKLHSPGSYATA